MRGAAQYATNGTSLFLDVPTARAGVLTRESRLYTFATGATKTLHVSYNLSEPIRFALDMEQSTVLLLQWPIPGGAPQAGDGVYLWTLPAGSPVHISHATPPHASLTARYVVWDNPTTMRLDLYDRTTGQVISPWKPSCIRPALALDCPYVMCVDYQRNSAHLVQVPSGKDIPLGWAKAETQGRSRQAARTGFHLPAMPPRPRQPLSITSTFRRSSSACGARGWPAEGQ